MKKLLLLMAALLLLIPPLYAQGEMTFFKRDNAVNYTATNPLKYVKTTSSGTKRSALTNFTSSTTGSTTFYFAYLLRYNTANTDYVKIETNVATTGRTPSTGLPFGTDKSISLSGRMDFFFVIW